MELCSIYRTYDHNRIRRASLRARRGGICRPRSKRSHEHFAGEKLQFGGRVKGPKETAPGDGAVECSNLIVVPRQKCVNS